MNAASKLLRAFKASPVSLIYALLKRGTLVMVLPVAALADLLVLIMEHVTEADADDLLGRDLEGSKKKGY